MRLVFKRAAAALMAKVQKTVGVWRLPRPMESGPEDEHARVALGLPIVGETVPPRQPHRGYRPRHYRGPR